MEGREGLIDLSLLIPCRYLSLVLPGGGGGGGVLLLWVSEPIILGTGIEGGESGPLCRAGCFSIPGTF